MLQNLSQSSCFGHCIKIASDRSQFVVPILYILLIIAFKKDRFSSAVSFQPWRVFDIFK